MADNRETIQYGQVSERDVNTATARVAMDDLNGYVSGKMQVLFPAIGGWNMFYTPKEGDHVVTGRLSNGMQEGYILGKVYTGRKMPQNGEPNIMLLVSDDGKNVIKFDADKGMLDLICDQDCSMKMNNLNIEVKEHVNVTAKTATVETENSVTVNSKEIIVEGKEEVTVKASKVVIDGTDTTITGGTFNMKGTVSPGTGPLCALTKCLFTNADHCGSQVTET